MTSTEIAALLKTAPNEHILRCALVAGAIDSGRWPSAATGLRSAAAMSEQWANQARTLANWCDAQAESGRIHSTVPATLDAPTPSCLLASAGGAPTLASLEAGLMALAHHLGREHAACVHRAMNGVLLATQHHTSPLLPDEAHAVGALCDSDSLEQGEAA